MAIKAIIFDFDGVLADSFKRVYALNKEAMAKIGRHLSKNRYRGFFMGNVHYGSKQFINNDAAYKKFSEFKKQNFGRYYLLVKLFPETPAFLNKIKERFILTIASSGEQDQIRSLLKVGGLEEYFQIIAANSDSSKEKMIKEIIKQLNFSVAKTILISDTCGDIALAKELGLKTGGVSWGFHSRSRLGRAKPDFIAKNFDELNFYLLKMDPEEDPFRCRRV